MPARGSHESDLIIRARPDAGAVARQAVTGWIGTHPRLDDLLLAVTELVNNAVVHGGLGAGDSLSLSMSTEDEHIRLTVSHAGPGFEVGARAAPSADPDASRGLAIVDLLADRWGVDSSDGTVSAWFEVSPGLTQISKG